MLSNQFKGTCKAYQSLFNLFWGYTMITNDDREYAITELSEAIIELKGHMDDEALCCIHSAEGALINSR